MRFYETNQFKMIFGGLILPAAIVLIASYFLVIEGKSAFPGRYHGLWFYGYQAYFVVCLWLGLAALLYEINFRRLRLEKKATKVGVYFYAGILLISVGLLASMFFTFVPKT